jgi:hypothetical protein
MTWQETENRRSKWDKRFKKVMTTYFVDQANSIMALDKIQEIASFSTSVNSMIDRDTSKLRKIYTTLYVDIINDFGKTVYNEFIGQKIFSIFAFGVYGWIASMALARAKKINGYSKLVVMNIVKKANEEGWTIRQTAKILRTVFIESFSKKRSIRIARTEVNTASNYGSYSGAKQTGLKLKKIWIATNDSRTRPTHRKAGRHPPIGIDELFKVGKGKMLYPGDQKGPVEEVVNCRCAIGYKREVRK